MSETETAEQELPESAESYQVVARRYRPKTFEELVGQSHVAQALANAITSGRIGHAYLFTGARGVGKTSTARIFAKSLNCVNGPTLTPCGECDSCQSISTGDDVDVLEYDGASNNSVDDIREIRKNVSIRPSRSRFKIYIIDEVHMLSLGAFNALLKILEEPPEHVKFIFCTTETTKIPITILSRCQRFDFMNIESSSIAKRLAEIAVNEHVTAEDGVFETLARRGNGSMRDAQSLLEQLLSFASGHLTLADVHEMLGTANDQLLFRLAEAMLQCDTTAVFKELDAAVTDGVDLGVLTEQLMGLFRDLLVVASGGDADLMLFCSPPQFEQIRQTAAAFGLHRLLAALQILDQTLTKMRFSTQGRILLELALTRIAHLEHFQMISVLIEQLKSGNISTGQAPSLTAPPLTVRPAQRVIAPPKDFKPEPVVELTPHERFTAAAVPQQNVSLETMTSAKAESVWNETIDAIPGMIGTWGSQAKQIIFEKPNTFAVTFGSKAALDFCRQESAKIQNALCRTLGQSVRVRFDFVEEKQAETPKESGHSRKEIGERLRAAAENPFIKQVEAVFGSELIDIRL